MEFESLASRLGIDKEDFLELVGLFITTTESDMDKVRMGMAQNATGDAAAAAHSIKGAAGNMGFSAMAELAGKMEFLAKKGSLDGFDAWADEMDLLLNKLGTSLSDE